MATNIPLRMLIMRAYRLLEFRLSGDPDLLPGPMRLLVLALIIRWALSTISLPLLARQFWSSLATLLIIAACVWLFMLLNSWGERHLRARVEKVKGTGSTSILRLGRRAMDALAIFIGCLVALFDFGVNLTAALAGLGV